MPNEELSVAVEDLVTALRRHAEVLSADDVEESRALAAMETLDVAMTRYAALVADRTDEVLGRSGALPGADGPGPDGRAALNGTAASESLTVTVRARYDYHIPDVEALLTAGQAARLASSVDAPEQVAPVTEVGEAIYELIQAEGPPLLALDVEELEPGSGLLTVHATTEPLVPDDFEDNQDDPEDLLFVEADEDLLFVLSEPRFDSEAEARAMAQRHATRQQDAP